MIGGCIEPPSSRSGFVALLAGYHNRGWLTYAGKVGSGYTERTLRDLTKRMQRLEQD